MAEKFLDFPFHIVCRTDSEEMENERGNDFYIAFPLKSSIVYCLLVQICVGPRVLVCYIEIFR